MQKLPAFGTDRQADSLINMLNVYGIFTGLRSRGSWVRSPPASPALAFPASDSQLPCALVLTCGHAGTLRRGTGGERGFSHGVGAVWNLCLGCALRVPWGWREGAEMSIGLVPWTTTGNSRAFNSADEPFAVRLAFGAKASQLEHAP